MDPPPTRPAAPASRSMQQRYPCAIIVRQPDIKQHMDVVTGGLDVSDHGVDSGIRISHQLGLVPSDRLGPAVRPAQVEKWPVEFRNVRAQHRRVPTRCLAYFWHGREYAPQSLGSSCADIGLTQ